MRLGPSRVAVACSIALVIGEGGCAIMMQQPPKQDRAPAEVPVCSTGRGGVALDGILAALLGVGALVALGNDEPGAGLAIGAIGGIYTYSAISGHRSADACEAALEDYRTELAVRRPEPPDPERPASAAVAPPPGAAAPERPAGPPVEEAAPAEEEAPPPREEEVVEAAPEPPAAPPPAAPRDWSDFWVEVKK